MKPKSKSNSNSKLTAVQTIQTRQIAFEIALKRSTRHASVTQLIDEAEKIYQALRKS